MRVFASPVTATTDFLAPDILNSSAFPAPTQASIPIRQGGILASRASTWPRDHFCRSTMAPRASWPTTWNEFLPISMPITAIAVLGCLGHGVLLVFGAPCQHRLLAGQEPQPDHPIIGP